jgi:hypothetical protein
MRLVRALCNPSWLVALVAAGAMMSACAGVKTAAPAGSGGTSVGAGGGGGKPSSGTGAGGTGVTVPPTGNGACTNLRCRQGSCTGPGCMATACPNGGTTSVSGTVMDPAGKRPLYNVVVYVPNESLQPLPEGAACETCNANFSGKPIAVALTDTAGHFKVDDVPVGANVPVVVQIGKWRRQLTVANVPSCADTPIATDLTRLPRNKSEGNIPKFAIATGGSDALECLLRDIGVDEAEFTSDTGSGRVHLFQGYRASPTVASNGASTSLKPVDQLWSSTASMMRYDIVLMACEGDSGQSEGRSAAQYQAVRGYGDMGGRVFGSHYHTNWVRSEDGQPNAGYPMVVKFSSGEGTLPDGFLSTVDTSFPKGVAFRDWLVNVGATPTPGQLAVNGTKHLVDSTVPGVSQQWLYGMDAAKKTPAVQYFSFTAPVGQKECGRMIFSDVHVAQGGGDSAAIPFPTRCGPAGTDLSPQAKALEFMLFDISSCVQKDDAPVQPPTIIP